MYSMLFSLLVSLSLLSLSRSLLLSLSSLTSSTSPCTLLAICNIATCVVHKTCMACPLYFIIHSPSTHDAPTYTKLEWLVHRILSSTLQAHATLRRKQNLNGLSIVFYRSHSVHMQCSDVNTAYQQVWGSLRLAPIIHTI